MQQQVELRAPLDLAAKYPVRDTRFVVASDATPPTGWDGWLHDRGSRGGHLRNVTLLDPSPAPETPPTWRPNGIVLEDAKSLVAEDLTVDIPGTLGVRIVGGRSLDFDRIFVTRCHGGFVVDSQWDKATFGLRLRRSSFTDGTRVGKTEFPSKRHPGEFMGTNGFKILGGVHVFLEDVFVGGEVSGVKIVASRLVTMRRCSVPNIHVQGELSRDGNPARMWMQDGEGSYGITLEDTRLWKPLSDHPHVRGVNVVQVSMNASVTLNRCDIRGDPGENTFGHGIQAAHRARVIVDGGSVGRCNGTRGGRPAAAFDFAPDTGSSIQTRNVVLWDQEREWSERSEASRAE